MRLSLPLPSLLLVLSVGASACGDATGGANAAPRDQAPSAPAVPTAPVTPAPAPSPPVAPEARAARTNPPPATLAPLQRAVADGRRLSRAGSHEEALAAFERALAIDPGSPKLRCEAGYVAFLASDHERAERYVTAAMRAFRASGTIPESQRVPVAMCLYNAGLVFEASERPSEAIDAWRRSLELRENTTVRARLQAISAGRGEAATPRASGAARDRAYADACGQGESMDISSCRMRRSADDVSEDTLVSITETTPTGAAPAGFTARIATAEGTIYFGISNVAYLEVGFGGRSLVGYLGRSWAPGVGGVSGELEIRRFEWSDVVPGGRPELVVESFDYSNDEDMGYCYRSGGTNRTLIVCSTDDGSLRCMSIAIEETTYEETYEGCEGETPAMHERGPSLAYAFAAGTLRLTPQQGAREGVPPELSRSRPVNEWLSDAAFRWPRPDAENGSR